jgi:DNA-binding transcriptional ArsR family regulator
MFESTGREAMQAYHESSKLLKAMAHPTRMRILDILTHGEACVCHLTALLGQRQPYVSQQLMVLREAGLVTDRREGTIVYYAVADSRVSEIIALLIGILGEQGIAVQRQPVPEPPVVGCTCPACVAAEKAA